MDPRCTPSVLPSKIYGRPWRHPREPLPHRLIIHSLCFEILLSKRSGQEEPIGYEGVGCDSPCDLSFAGHFVNRRNPGPGPEGRGEDLEITRWVDHMKTPKL